MSSNPFLDGLRSSNEMNPEYAILHVSCANCLNRVCAIWCCTSGLRNQSS